MSDKSLFISISPEEYKSNKNDLLNSQTEVLNSMKNMHRMVQLKREKTKLKNRMNRLLNSLLKDIDELEVQLPKPKIPKKIREKKQSITQPIQIEEKFEEEIEQQDKIEQELLNVREKLKKLNG